MITVEIPKKEVYQNVMALTAVIGRNRQIIQSVAVSPDNLPVLGIYLAEAVTEAENELHRHVQESTAFSFYADEEKIVFRFEDKLRRKEGAYNQIASTLNLFLSHYTTSRWLGSIEAVKDLAEPYQSSAGGYLDKLQLLVCQHKAYVVEENIYETRLKDEAAMEDSKGQHIYETRRKDLQPVCRRWHDGVMLTEDPAILTDSKGNILVSKT